MTEIFSPVLRPDEEEADVLEEETAAVVVDEDADEDPQAPSKIAVVELTNNTLILFFTLIPYLELFGL